MSDDLDILSHALMEAHEDAQKAKAVPPPPPPRRKPPVPEPEPPKAGKFWIVFGAGVLVLIAAGVWFVMNLPEPPHPATIEAERLFTEANEREVASRNAETQRDTSRLQSQSQWQQAATTINNAITLLRAKYTSEAEFAELREQQAALRKTLAEQIAAACKAEDESVKNESRSAALANEALDLRLEAIKLLQDAGIPSAVAATTEKRTTDRPKLAADDDATESLYTELDFATAEDNISLLDFCPIIDSSRRAGLRSWRLIATTTAPLAVTFPKSRDAAWDISAMTKLSLAVQFPRRDKLPRGSLPENTAQIAAMSVTFHGPSGEVEYATVSPKMLETIFYKASGAFVNIDVPLYGNSPLWSSRDMFDITALNTEETVTDSKPLTPRQRFFRQIDAVTIRALPASPITSLWIDDVRCSSQPLDPPINFRQEETLQQRSGDRERWRDSLRQ